MTFTIKLSKTLILMCGIILTSITHAQDYPVGKKSGTGGISRIAPINGVEGFEGAGWNAGNTKGTYSPGLDTSLPKYFKFKQFQGPHSFKAETSIVRFGQYSAKLHWKHNDPGQWNDDPNKIDNSDRKAMFHGQNASSNQATVWYGFSVYFPSASTVMNGEEEALFFQLHGGRDNNGEPNRVPPVALTFNKDEFKLGYSWDSNKISTDVRGEGQEHVHVPVTLSDYQDRWVDVVVQVRSNPFERNGFIKVWLDGKQMFNKTDIQLGYNDDQGIYPSYGWYIFWQNNLERNNDAIMYLDEIRQVEDTNADYYDVAPGYFANKGISTVNYCPNSNLNPADEVFGFKYAVAAKSLLTINQPTDIAYGAKGQFAYIYNQTTDITCDNSTFGGDPIYGVKKYCYTRPAQTIKGPQAYEFATEEKTEFTSTGTVNSAYGANGQYKYKYNVYNDVVCGKTTMSCNNSTFGGDPISGVKKDCYYQEVTPNGGPSGYLYGTTENTILQINKTVDVAYGANKTFKYLENQSTNISCNNSKFGGDPIPGVKKHCYIKSNTGARLD